MVSEAHPSPHGVGESLSHPSGQTVARNSSPNSPSIRDMPMTPGRDAINPHESPRTEIQGSHLGAAGEASSKRSIGYRRQHSEDNN